MYQKLGNKNCQQNIVNRYSTLERHMRKSKFTISYPDITQSPVLLLATLVDKLCDHFFIFNNGHTSAIS